MADPALLSLALLVGVWAVLRAIVGGTIAITTRADHPPWLLSLVFAVAAGVIGVILIAGSSGSVRRIAVTIGLLLLLEGTGEISEAALRDRGKRRLRRGARRRTQRWQLPDRTHGSGGWQPAHPDLQPSARACVRCAGVALSE